MTRTWRTGQKSRLRMLATRTQQVCLLCRAAAVWLPWRSSCPHSSCKTLHAAQCGAAQHQLGCSAAGLPDCPPGLAHHSCLRCTYTCRRAAAAQPARGPTTQHGGQPVCALHPPGGPGPPDAAAVPGEGNLQGCTTVASSDGGGCAVDSVHTVPLLLCLPPSIRRTH